MGRFILAFLGTSFAGGCMLDRGGLIEPTGGSTGIGGGGPGSTSASGGATTSATSGGGEGGGAGGLGGAGGEGGIGGMGGEGGGGLLCRDYPNALPLLVNGQVHCYWLRTTKETQAEASLECGAEGGYLATIHSVEENSHVLTLATGNLPVWIGMRCDISSSSSCASSKSNYTWLTNEPLTYDGWGVGEPSGGRGTAMHVDGTWHSYHSTDNEYSFVCEAGALVP
jgi:hypothetical protein